MVNSGKTDDFWLQYMYDLHFYFLTIFLVTFVLLIHHFLFGGANKFVMSRGPADNLFKF